MQTGWDNPYCPGCHARFSALVRLACSERAEGYQQPGLLLTCQPRDIFSWFRTTPPLTYFTQNATQPGASVSPLLSRTENTPSAKKKAGGEFSQQSPKANGGEDAWGERRDAGGTTAGKPRGNPIGEDAVGALSPLAQPAAARGAAGVPQAERRPCSPSQAGEIHTATAFHFAWLQAVLLSLSA